ncbi:MAG: flagellar type III secretion system pore protein FliP, partial [Planctomycetaceae bacterium]
MMKNRTKTTSASQALPAPLRRAWTWSVRLLPFVLAGWMAIGVGSSQAEPGDAPRTNQAVSQPAPVEPRQPVAEPPQPRPIAGVDVDVDQMLSPGGMSATLKVMILLTVLSLAPSALIMTTCFIRFVIVFGLLRQALGTQQLPPNQVITSLCLFLTMMVMAPVWQRAYDEGVRPYTQGEPIPGLLPNEDPLHRAFINTVRPLREFMADQIETTGNSDAVWLFLEYQRPNPESAAGRNYRMPETYEEVPLSVLLPAYMMSELKTAFIIGFQIYLPFLVIDLVVSS